MDIMTIWKRHYVLNFGSAMTKAELESKTAIEGQTALLEKYKTDYDYEKLPWLRKLIHF